MTHVYNKYILLAAILISFLSNESFAQIPAGYYDIAIGKTGNDLKIALHNTIKGHHALSYSELWGAYNTTDKIPSTSKIWDIYSNNPGGTTAYTFTYSSDQCGGSTPSSEGGCYNREHSFPQSLFDGNMPMYTDLWIVYPTDAYVNGKRGNYPYGEVNVHTWISTNGSKLGSNAYPGAPTTMAFEPHDSFKGDIARSYFYLATRYYSQDASWNTWEMSNGADLKPWAKAMLLSWHHLDPVSQKEIDRNNAIYHIQDNRNPFIDHPEFADCIFGTSDCRSLLSTDDFNPENFYNIYPNPAQDYISISSPINKRISAVKIFSILGIEKINFVVDQSNNQHINIKTSELSAGQYFVLVVDEKGQTFSSKLLKL